jgi:hypothetical protein
MLAAAYALRKLTNSFGQLTLKTDKLFFIYVAKNDEWNKLQTEDWAYVSGMARFYHWWMRRYFDINLPVEAEILPVIPGLLFDRMSVDYLIRDHSERNRDTYHLYLSYFKPFFTDCNTEGYTAANIGISWWQRPKENISETKRYALYADTNCPRVSHVLAHELVRMKGKTKKNFLGKVHEIWDNHTTGMLSYLYFDSQFKRVTKEDSYKFVTLDPAYL